MASGMLHQWKMQYSRILSWLRLAGEGRLSRLWLSDYCLLLLWLGTEHWGLLESLTGGGSLWLELLLGLELLLLRLRLEELLLLLLWLSEWLLLLLKLLWPLLLGSIIC